MAASKSLAGLLLEMGFPTWAQFFTPRDYMLGDRDGVVRVPAARVEEIVAAAEGAVATENKVRTTILEGMDPQAAYLAFGKF